MKYAFPTYLLVFLLFSCTKKEYTYDLENYINQTKELLNQILPKDLNKKVSCIFIDENDYLYNKRMFTNEEVIFLFKEYVVTP